MCNDANAIINRPLPDTLSECRDYIAELQALATQQQALLAEHELLIAALKKRVFGRRSEKSHKPPDEATPAEIAEELKPPKPKKAHSGGGRAPLPKYLPRETTLCDLPEADKVCPECGKPMKCIGVDATEKLDARPIELFVRRVERPRYACGSCKCGVLQQPLAPQALPRTDATAGLATLLVLWKYEDHLPLSRLERILDRSGIELDRGRMCDWLMAVAELVAPLVNLMEQRILTSGCACADETHLPMQAPGRTKRCWLWASRGLDNLAPYTVFRFAETRGAGGLPEAYSTFSGRLLTDAYSVYDKQAREHGEIILHGCLAHARRKFVEALDAGDKTAREAIDLIGALYEIEWLAKDLAPDVRAQMRWERSALAFAHLKDWLDRHTDLVPKSPLGKAVNYTLGRWQCIIRVLEDGRMPIDNNALERDIRPVALGRKNWLFAGSPRGGRAAAMFFSLIESCKRSGHNTFEYLSDILGRIGSHPVNRLDELLPDKWHKPAPTPSPPAPTTA